MEIYTWNYTDLYAPRMVNLGNTIAPFSTNKRLHKLVHSKTSNNVRQKTNLVAILTNLLLVEETTEYRARDDVYTVIAVIYMHMDTATLDIR